MKTTNILLAFAILVAFLLILPYAVSSDTPSIPISSQWNVERGIELPIGKTEWEIANEYLFPIDYPTDDPPPQPAVNPAEWEPMTGVLIRYPFGLSYSIIAEMSEDVEVKTIVSSTTQMNTVLNNFQNNGVNVANCTFLIAPSNSMWTRDYGPWYIFQGQNVQGIVDHIYNRPTRPDDNRIPERLGDSLNIPVYALPLIHTGGNYMSDGMGIGMSTNLVWNENPTLTHDQIADLMHDYCGLENYMVVPDILTGGIHHIDCWAKLLDPGRILVKLLTPTNAQLEANVALWQNTISSYGRPYQVIRVSCASSTPYTNSLILDDKVFVPLFNNVLDAQAMATYTSAMPGYEILGFTGSWVSDDAIHCRAMGMTDRYMLRITHVPLFDQINNTTGYLIAAKVHAYSNMPLEPGQPQLFWKIAGGTFAPITMTNTVGDSFIAYIPPQADNTTIYYYLHAEDDSGRVENHPYIGAPNAHHFKTLTANPMTVTVTPTNPPIVIPATGGTFNYSLNITNTSPISLVYDGWVTVSTPTGLDYEVLVRFNLGLAPGATLTRAMTQSIPANAPAGNYNYSVEIGQYPLYLVYDEDGFPFTKSAGYDFNSTEGDWTLAGLDETPEIASLAPHTYPTLTNYPNPFNATTTISYELRQSGNMRLEIFDVTGRMVLKLVESYAEAGSYTVSFDAGDLASGIYFAVLRIGEINETQKMMLIK